MSPFQDKSLLLNGIFLEKRNICIVVFYMKEKTIIIIVEYFLSRIQIINKVENYGCYLLENCYIKIEKNIQICNVIYCIYIEGTEGLKAYMHFKNVLKNCNECY